ncbi:MAG: hypothetical protein ACOZF2_13995 [Thermodesulfobacteriota bacterium]
MMRLAAIILAIILISPGILWGQGSRPEGQVKSSPRQADKSFFLDQQKKRPRIRDSKKKTRSNRKKQVRSSPKKQSQPATKSKKSSRRTK